MSSFLSVQPKKPALLLGSVLQNYIKEKLLSLALTLLATSEKISLQNVCR